MSDKKYTSPSTGDDCTAAQYLAEMMVTRDAHNKKKPLPNKFWNVQPWKGKFTQQIIKANGLLKIYPAHAIISALKSKQGSKIYSLQCPWLDELIDEQVRKMEVVEKLEVKEFADNTKSKPMKPRAKKTTIAKLRDLDD
jgi:hypothetical protein